MAQRSTARLEQIVDYLAAAPFGAFVGRSEGALVGTDDWAIRLVRDDAALHLIPEGAVPPVLAARLAAATKRPATATDWLAWSRAMAPETVLAAADQTAAAETRAALVDDWLRRQELDVAALAMLVGRGDGVAEYTGDAWVLTVRVAEPWLEGVASVDLRISGVAPDGVARSGNVPGDALCAELDPVGRAWFVRVGGVALWWPEPGTTLELAAGGRRWLIGDPVAEAARLALCDGSRR